MGACNLDKKEKLYYDSHFLISFLLSNVT